MERHTGGVCSLESGGPQCTAVEQMAVEIRVFPAVCAKSNKEFVAAEAETAKEMGTTGRGASITGSVRSLVIWVKRFKGCF